MVCGEHGGSIADFLAKAPDPPISESVTSAINLLKVSRTNYNKNSIDYPATGVGTTTEKYLCFPLPCSQAGMHTQSVNVPGYWGFG